MTKAGTYHFGCSSETELANWKSAIQSVAFKDDSSDVMVEEDNDLYSTSGDGTFTVKIVETEASRNCGLEVGKNYTLIIGAADMKLVDFGKTLFTWPYQFIRKYGYRNATFTFEAGRKCDSGEGAFCLEHKNQLDIYKCFTAKKAKMKQMLSGENSPSVECNDAQFQAALSMEAGSRSPLPPANNLIDLDMPSISSQFSQNSQPTSISPSPPKRPVKPPLPAKPKRLKPPKPVLTTTPDEKLFDCESMDGKYRKMSLPSSPEVPSKSIVVTKDTDKHSYDFVEVRTNAWKTYGIGSIPHTERSKQTNQNSKKEDIEQDIESPHYEKVIFPLSQTNSVKSNSSSIIYNITNPNDPPDYDKLQHFGSIHKSKKNSGYRTPNSSTLSQSSSIDSNLGSNDYDVVENISTVRLNDTPRYGMIRKQSNSSILSSNNSESQHKVDDSEYALVSKPKHV